jgi:hypothetical protein
VHLFLDTQFTSLVRAKRKEKKRKEKKRKEKKREKTAKV